MALSVTGMFHFYLRDNLSLRIVPAVAVSGCGFPSPLPTLFELCAMFAPNDLTQFLLLGVSHPTLIRSSTPLTVSYPLFFAKKDNYNKGVLMHKVISVAAPTNQLKL